MYDIYGRMAEAQFSYDARAQILEMFKPVRCTCGHIYDIGTVTVTARYADCSVWTTPCCKRSIDDRGETGWTNRQDYTVIDKATLR